MKTRAEIEEEVVATISRAFNLPRERVTAEAHLIQDLDLDSIDAIDLAVQLEARVGVAPKGEDLRRLRTVGDVVSFVEKQLSSPNGSA